MARPTPGKRLAAKRTTKSRKAIHADGPRPLQISLSDTTSPEFIAECRREALAIAAGDPAGDEVMRFIEGLYEWPEK